MVIVIENVVDMVMVNENVKVTIIVSRNVVVTFMVTKNEMFVVIVINNLIFTLMFRVMASHAGGFVGVLVNDGGYGGVFGVDDYHEDVRDSNWVSWYVHGHV